MTRTFPRLFLLALGAAALAPFAACSGGGGDDDDDDTTIEPTHCQILWSNIGSAQLRYDVFVVDMPIDEWSTGEKEYTIDTSNEVIAIFYDEYEFETRVYAARAITTSGTFNVTTVSTSAGSAVMLNDPGAQEFFDIDGENEIGNLVATGGAANFDGNWSDPDPEVPPDPGTGTATLTFVGTSGASIIGTSFVNYAVCYEEGSSFAPQSATQRVEAQFARRLRE